MVQYSKWKGKEPQAVGLHKTNIKLLVFGVFALVGGLSILGFSSHEPQIKELRSPENGTSKPTEIISSLPKDYSDWVDPKPKPFLNKKVYQNDSEQSKSEMSKFLDQQRVKRRRSAIAARESDLFVGRVGERRNMHSNRDESEETYKIREFEDVPEGILNPREQSNRQDEKARFLHQPERVEEQIRSRLRAPRSPYELLAGTLIPGVLLTGLNSDLPGQIVAQVSRNIYDTVSGRFLLIPQGTKLIGLYDSQIAYGQQRLLVVWRRLILPNGKSISLQGMPGVDLSGEAGLSSRVNNHYGKLFSGVILGSLLGAGTQVVSGPNSRTLDPSFTALAAQGTAQNLNQAGQEITKRNLNIQPTLEVSPGARFSVFVTKDLVLEPYKKE